MLLYALSLFATLTYNQSTKFLCTDNNPDTTPGHFTIQQIEKKILDTIFGLPEFKKELKYVKEKSKGKRTLQVIIYETPKESHKEYYWVKVVEDNGSTLATHFNFYVYPGSFIIKYLDTVKDKAINLSEWQHRQKNHS